MPLDGLTGEPKRYDLEVVTGDSFKQVIRFSELVDGVKTPIDLTDYEVAAQIRDAPRQNLVTDFDAQVTDAVNGEVTLRLTTAQTLCFTGNASWDLQLILTADPPNNTHTVLAGDVIVVLDITKPT